MREGVKIAIQHVALPSAVLPIEISTTACIYCTLHKYHYLLTALVHLTCHLD